jgi:glycosyltransferase involved in cell wall biosynthesis
MIANFGSINANELIKGGNILSVPQVSIIMNCYNSAEFLKEALASILSQSFKDWELIFWDNQSTDHSAAIFHDVSDSRFKYFYADSHTSLGEARNLAVSKASGHWLAFIDCDDIWYANKLEVQLSKINGNTSDVGLIYGLVKILVEDTQAESVLANFYTRLVIKPHEAENISLRLLQGNFIIFSSAMVLREIFLKVGGIDTSFRQNEDYDLLLNASMISRAICVPEVCVIYRVHSSNNSHMQEELSYQENSRIYSALPQSEEVRNAIKLNNSRYAIYKIVRGNIFSGIRLLFTQGAVVWTFGRIIFRILTKFSQKKWRH